MPSRSSEGDGPSPYSVDVEVGQTTYEQPPAEPYQLRSVTREAALREPNADAWLYARAAFLFFCALLIAWIPSSVNRIYSLVHPHHMVYSLNFAEAIVLPLQGFWNCCVYIITSQTAVKNIFRACLGTYDLQQKNPYVGNGATGSKKRKAKNFLMRKPTKSSNRGTLENVGIIIQVFQDPAKILFDSNRSGSIKTFAARHRKAHC